MKTVGETIAALGFVIAVAAAATAMVGGGLQFAAWLQSVPLTALQWCGIAFLVGLSLLFVGVLIGRER